jgi:hypothetical protein
VQCIKSKDRGKKIENGSVEKKDIEMVGIEKMLARQRL